MEKVSKIDFEEKRVWWTQHNEYSLFDECVLMQYIGIKDKNKKKIFENDIVEILAEDGNFNRFIVKFGIARRIMESGWEVDIPGFYFDLIGGDFKAFPIVNNYKGIHDLDMMQIIGNIFETPELAIAV
jgi:uncharacterized phage protein (TIGR01671 family)